MSKYLYYQKQYKFWLKMVLWTAILGSTVLTLTLSFGRDYSTASWIANALTLLGGLFVVIGVIYYLCMFFND